MPVRENHERGHEGSAPKDAGASVVPTDLPSDLDLAVLVDRFYAAVLADEALAPYFAGVSMDRLKGMQRELFGAALGSGPLSAASRLQETHAHLHLEPRQVSRFFEHLVDTMNELDVDRDVIDRLVTRLAPYVDDVVGSHGEGG